MFDEIFEEIIRIDIGEDKVILVTIIWLKKKNVGYIKLKVSWLEYEYTFSKKQCKIEDTYWKVLWFYELFLHYFNCKVNICNLQAIWENPFVKLKIVCFFSIVIWIRQILNLERNRFWLESGLQKRCICWNIFSKYFTKNHTWNNYNHMKICCWFWKTTR